VQTVNGQTGTVLLTAANVGALDQAGGDARYEPLDSAFTKLESDARYVFIGGDTMTGPLVIDPVNANLTLGAPLAANTPYIAFRSSGLPPVFDSRIHATGGTAVDGTGQLVVTGQLLVTGTLSAATMAAGTSLTINARPVIMAGCRVTHNASTTAVHATNSVVLFGVIRYDTDGFWAVGSPTRLTVPAGLGGIYAIAAEVDWGANNDSTMRSLQLRVNGGTYIAIQTGPALATAGQPTRQAISTIYQLAAGDYCEVVVYHLGGVNLLVTSVGNISPEFSMQRIG
jgi:hypothetical protein